MVVSYWVYFELGLGLSGLTKRKRNGLEWAYLKEKEMGLSGLFKRKRNGLEWVV